MSTVKFIWKYADAQTVIKCFSRICDTLDEEHAERICALVDAMRKGEVFDTAKGNKARISETDKVTAMCNVLLIGDFLNGFAKAERQTLSLFLWCLKKGLNDCIKTEQAEYMANIKKGVIGE